MSRFGSFSSCALGSGWIFGEDWRESVTPPEVVLDLGGGVNPATGGATELLGGPELIGGEGFNPDPGPVNIESHRGAKINSLPGSQ